MTEEYKDMVTLKGIQTSPEYYVITEAEYIAVLKADSAIDRVTRRYMAINERGQRSIIVTDATLKEIRAAFKEEDINERAIVALANDVLSRRKWYYISVVVGEDGQTKPGYVVFTSDGRQQEVGELNGAGEGNIPELAAALNMPREYKYLPSDWWYAIKQIDTIFNSHITEQNGIAIAPPELMIRQGVITNTLTKIRAVEGRNTEINPITHEATIKKGNFILTVPNYTTTKGLRTSTHQLLDALVLELTKTGAKSPTVIVPLDQYMSMRGLKDRKETKAQVVDDMKILKHASVTGEERRGKNTQSYSFVNIADSGEVARNGDIVFTFGTTFYNMLLGYPVMPYSILLQSIDSRKNPNSYYMLRKILEHKNMNQLRTNENRISVRTLLEVAPYIPSFDEVMKGNRNVRERIIDVFERDLDALSSEFKWEYINSGGAPLTDEQLANMNYDIFSELCIEVHWLSTFEYSRQKALDRRAKAKEAGAKPKKRGRPKKTAE